MSPLSFALTTGFLLQYYVYICDLVSSIEHMHTPLQAMLDLEAQIRGSIAGFVPPQFVVDPPSRWFKAPCLVAHSLRSNDRPVLFRCTCSAEKGQHGSGVSLLGPIMVACRTESGKLIRLKRRISCCGMLELKRWHDHAVLRL
jgi:hypothetical protein